jgi:sulfur carrier protein
VRVSINGREREVAMPLSVAAAASLAGVAAGERGVAVAVDGLVVARPAWEATEVPAGAAVEVVRAAAGG